MLLSWPICLLFHCPGNAHLHHLGLGGPWFLWSCGPAWSLASRVPQRLSLLQRPKQKCCNVFSCCCCLSKIPWDTGGDSNLSPWLLGLHQGCPCYGPSSKCGVGARAIQVDRVVLQQPWEIILGHLLPIDPVPPSWVSLRQMPGQPGDPSSGVSQGGALSQGCCNGFLAESLCYAFCPSGADPQSVVGIIFNSTCAAEGRGCPAPGKEPGVSRHPACQNALQQPLAFAVIVFCFWW